MKKFFYAILCMLTATIVYTLIVLQPWSGGFLFNKDSHGAWYLNRLESFSGIEIVEYDTRQCESVTIFSMKFSERHIPPAMFTYDDLPPDYDPNSRFAECPNPAKFLPHLPGWDYDKNTKRFFHTSLSRKGVQERARIEGYEDSVNSLLQ